MVIVWILALLPHRVNPALVSSSVMRFWTLFKRICRPRRRFRRCCVENTLPAVASSGSEREETLPAVVSSEREESAVGKITIALK